MIRKTLKISSMAMVFGLMLLGVMSCIRERIEMPRPIGNKQVDITFSLDIPGEKIPSTRAMDNAAENKIDRIDILVFKKVGSDEKFAYHTKANGSITDDGGDANKKFTARVELGNDFRFVILANLTASASSALSEILYTDTRTKEQILSTLVHKTTGGWNATTGSSAPIPMWGESALINVTENMIISGVSLKRMLARIDIVVTDPSFILETADLYNYNNGGFVAPQNITGPSVPGASDGVAIQTSAINYISQSNKIEKAIYVYEAEAGAEADLAKSLCLVVGGKTSADGETTYYRVDIRDNNGDYFPLLRNHLYKINIKSISGRGYVSSSEAYASLPENLVSEMTYWDRDQYREIVYDNHYALGVNKSKFKFTEEPRPASSTENKLKVLTDYPDGWEIYKTTYAVGSQTGWLTIAANEMNSTVNPDGKISLLATENTGDIRIGYIHIRAGKLMSIIEVIQTDLPAISIDILSNNKSVAELHFASWDGQLPAEKTAQSYTVKWIPKESTCDFGVSRIGNISTIDFASGITGIKGSFNSVTGEYTVSNILPTPFTAAEVSENVGDPFLVKGSKVEYTVSNGPEFASKSINIYHTHYDAIPRYSQYYPLDGKPLHFYIKSNTKWKVECVSPPDGLFEVPFVPVFGENDINGTKISFTAKNYIDNPNPALNDRNKEFTATFKISSIDSEKRFSDKTFTVTFTSGTKLASSNCHIVEPSTNRLLIPISRVNKVPSSFGIGQQISSERFNAEFLWTDNINGMSSTSCVADVKAVGMGSDGYIMISTGSSTGNALIGASLNDKLLWSWHIWVVSSKSIVEAGTGIGNVWMDRNLGAMDNTGASAIGLLYQWGRKDPFPGGKGFAAGAANRTPIYGASGTTALTYGTLFGYAASGIEYSMTPAVNNLANSIMNPMTIYAVYSTVLPGSKTRDWYTNSDDINNQNDYLWCDSEGKKTIFDPCPRGWCIPKSAATGNDTWGTESYLGLTTTSTPVAKATYGVFWQDKGGYYPFGSQSAFSSINPGSSLTNGATSGGYHCAMPLPNKGSAENPYGSVMKVQLTTTSLTLVTAATLLQNRQAASRVRCVKYTGPEPE